VRPTWLGSVRESTDAESRCGDDPPQGWTAWRTLRHPSGVGMTSDPAPGTDRGAASLPVCARVGQQGLAAVPERARRRPPKQRLHGIYQSCDRADGGDPAVGRDLSGLLPVFVVGTNAQLCRSRQTVPGGWLQLRSALGGSFSPARPAEGLTSGHEAAHHLTVPAQVAGRATADRQSAAAMVTSPPLHTVRTRGCWQQAPPVSTSPAGSPQSGHVQEEDGGAALGPLTARAVPA